MSEIDLTQKFPHMTPISGPPSLFKLNGFGLGLYGRRDHDLETGTYVKSLCLCALWIPFFFLRAYRVADAEGGGWYFLGRHSLSPFATFVNSGVIALAVATIFSAGFGAYRSTPEYQAKQTMAEAEEHAAAGREAQAVKLWAQVVDSGTDHAVTAEEKLTGSIDAAMSSQRAGDLAAATRAALTVVDAGAKERLTGGLYEGALTIVDERTEDEPRGSFYLLDAITTLAPEGVDLSPRREALLERLVVAEPDDPHPASELAAILEERGEFGRCEAILEPHAERLATLEGARILGQIRAAEGDLEQSRALLLPYTEGRLQSLQAAQMRYDQAYEAIWDREIARLEQGEAGDDWYQQYDAADEAGQSHLVQEWVGQSLREDPGLGAAEEALIAGATIVPVALDLGIIMVQRAHGLDSGERRHELEAAEKIFLGIRGYAGETDEYRLSLGQVYYWLGRPEEGQTLFDELVAAHERDPEMLILVGQTLRDVGVASEARELAEEAYETALDGEVKFAAASLRALLYTDYDDQVVWYKRCDPKHSGTRASLHSAQGNAAEVKGRTAEAIDHYRKALAVYETFEESGPALNNAALVHFSIFSMTGDRSELRAGAAKMERSVALQPGSRIVLGNATSPLIQEAVLDAVGDRVDITVLKSGVGTNLLGFLHDDGASRKEVLGSFTAHPSAVKARGFLEKVLVLAPRDASGYDSLLALIDGAPDEERSLRRLLEKLEATDVDHGTAIQQARKFYAGEDLETQKEEYQAYIDKLRRGVDDSRRGGGLTFAVAASGLANTLAGADAFGIEVDVDELVALAEVADAAVSSEATRDALRSALFFRATRTLAAASPEWADLLERSRQTLPASYLVALVFSSGSPLAEAAGRDPDARRAIEMVIEDNERYPHRARPVEWALLRTAKPQLATNLARRTREQASVAMWRELRHKLSPTSAAAACNLHWLRLIQERPAEASTALQSTAGLGVPIPAEFLSS